MNDRELELIKAYAISWPKLVDREESPTDVRLSLAIEGFEPFTVRLLMKAAPNSTKALLTQLPFKGHLIHSAWSGCGVRCLERVTLLGIDAYENSTYFPIPGDFSYTVGHDELTIFYGDASPTMPSGKIAVSTVGVISGRLPEFQRACILTRLTGARPFSMKKL
jgi:hypothetical protein